MGAIYDALVELSPGQDTEMREGYRRYEEELAEALTPQQIESYADYIRQEGEIRIFEEMTASELSALPPDMEPVAMAIKESLNASMENRRVVALLNQRGQHAVAPDLGPSS